MLLQHTCRSQRGAPSPPKRRKTGLTSLGTSSRLSRRALRSCSCTPVGSPHPDGWFRQRALEIEARTRLAGPTMPSHLKHSNSLAKLDGLQLSSHDLCSACSSDAASLALFVSESPEQAPTWDCLAMVNIPCSGPRKASGRTSEGELAGGDWEARKAFPSPCLHSFEEVGTWNSSG